MTQFKPISLNDAYVLLTTENTDAVLLDIRDHQAFQLAHSPLAFHLTNETMIDLLNTVEFEQPIVVMCYHGISSQGAAQYLINQGYESVYSLDGGFTAWQREVLPTVTME